MKCHCIIYHPETEPERLRVLEALESARATGDTARVTLALAQLTGPCPGLDWAETESGVEG